MSLMMLAKEDPKAINALYRYKHHVFADGALSNKDKEIIATVISVMQRCEVCVQVHGDAALEAGATKDELREAIEVAMYLGGPSTVIWSPIVDKYITDQQPSDES